MVVPRTALCPSGENSITQHAYDANGPIAALHKTVRSVAGGSALGYTVSCLANGDTQCLEFVVAAAMAKWSKAPGGRPPIPGGPSPIPPARSQLPVVQTPVDELLVATKNMSTAVRQLREGKHLSEGDQHELDEMLIETVDAMRSLITGIEQLKKRPVIAFEIPRDFLIRMNLEDATAFLVGRKAPLELKEGLLKLIEDVTAKFNKLFPEKDLWR